MPLFRKMRTLPKADSHICLKFYYIFAIFLAATTCSFHNSPLNAYYKKKRDQGKHHLTATGAVARKLTTVIYAVLRDSKPYEPKKFC